MNQDMKTVRFLSAFSLIGVVRGLVRILRRPCFWLDTRGALPASLVIPARGFCFPRHGLFDSKRMAAPVVPDLVKRPFLTAPEAFDENDRNSAHMRFETCRLWLKILKVYGRHLLRSKIAEFKIVKTG